MGRSKAWLPFGDQTMLQRVVSRLGEVVSPIVVVAAVDQPLPVLPEGVLIAHDRNPQRGPLEGLRAGITALADQVDAVFATSCDVPLIEPAFVRHMIGLLGDHRIAVPQEGRFWQPLAAVYRTDVLTEIDQLLDADRLRPAFLFEQVDSIAVETESLRAVDPDLDTLANLNRPEDYFAALKRCGYDVPPEI